MRELDISGLTDDLVSKFYSGKSIKSLKSTKSQWDSVPYRSTVAFTMTRIVGAILLLRKFQRSLHETYGSLYQLMSKTQFMSFALITIGLCSRLSVISKAWANELQDCYALLEEWMKLLPKETVAQGVVDYENELPESLNEVLDRSSTRVPDTPLPSTPALPNLSDTTLNIEDGSDLGQVIQRRMDDDEEDEEEKTSVVLETNSRKSSRRTSEDHSIKDISAKTLKKTKKDSDTPSIADSPSHSHLLAELDTVFGGTPSPRDTPSPRPGTGSIKKKKKSKPSQDINDIFGSSSSSLGTPPSGITKKKAATPVSDMDSIFGVSSPRDDILSDVPKKKKKKSTLNQEMDDIFGSGSSSRNDTPPPGSTSDSTSKKKSMSVSSSDINDIFGSIATPPKKKKAAAGSEIDNIFGPPKKKKKNQPMS
ncbi:hypothetical protein BGZ83_001655 [Gryganskiella cystojenkinii]|nr:hypothetical protein BGZ83_001655 [Gryganskiella cystojenkinii]